MTEQYRDRNIFRHSAAEMHRMACAKNEGERVWTELKAAAKAGKFETSLTFLLPDVVKKELETQGFEVRKKSKFVAPEAMGVYWHTVKAGGG